MSNETTYGLVEPFDCDDLAFCLGVEWEMFRQKLKSDLPFRDLIHTENAERLVAMCERQGRFCESIQLDAGFEEWTQIVVGVKK